MAPKLTLATVPAEDPHVYDMIDAADTMGVFQIESRAQMSMLPRLRPRCFYDLVIEVAIVRPGPIQGDMVHPYLRRRAGQEPVEYPDERIRGVLEKTLGVPLFQEQAMRLAVVAAGFTPGEADQLRRAMGAWRRRGIMDVFQKKLMDGMKANGYAEKFADQVFRQIQGFGSYGFPESHAASFALLVYVSAWLKCYFPAVFCAGLINSQPMGFYAPAQLVANARQHGVEVRPVDVNFSDWDCTLEPPTSCSGSRQTSDDASGFVGSPATSASCPPLPPPAETECHAGTASAGGEGRGEGGKSLAKDTPLAKGMPPSPPTPLPPPMLFSARDTAIAGGGRGEPPGSTVSEKPPGSAVSEKPLALRLGLRLVAGLSHAHGERIVAERQRGRFVSFEDFVERTGLHRYIHMKLAGASVFESLGLSRRQALWLSMTASEPLPLFDRVPEEVPAELPAMSRLQEVLSDYGAAGLTLREHPVHFLRPFLAELKAVRASDLRTLPTGRVVKVGGVVLMRQRPSTAKGVTFVTLEDETGIANLIVWQNIWEKYRRVAFAADLLLAQGALQREGDVIHVIVSKLEDLSPKLAEFQARSRDFR